MKDSIKFVAFWTLMMAICWPLAAVVVAEDALWRWRQR